MRAVHVVTMAWLRRMVIMEAAVCTGCCEH